MSSISGVFSYTADKSALRAAAQEPPAPEPFRERIEDELDALYLRVQTLQTLVKSDIGSSNSFSNPPPGRRTNS